MDGNDLHSGKIDDKIVNQLSNTKKMNFKAGFLAFKTSLTFIQ